MKRSVYLLPLLFLTAACASDQKSTALPPAPSENPLNLPEPAPGTETKNYSRAIGWPEGQTPKAPEGFAVKPFAKDLNNPRWIYQAPNGDIFVAEAKTIPRNEEAKKKQKEKGDSEAKGPSANRITLLRDRDGDGIAETKKIFATGLNQPFGMAIIGPNFYVAATDGLWRFPYRAGDEKLDTAKGKKLLELPAGGYNNHWTRNLLVKPDGSKIYISVGSGSNVGENGLDKEVRRANILEVNPDGSGERIFAAGLRNPVGMDWNPANGELWTAVNERDELGDELVPDYATSVKEGGFYGWPFAYMGKTEDPRRQGERPDLVERTLDPDVLLGSHTASLGLAFYDRPQFPERYRNGLFIGQHGSWNHSQLVGYKVVFVPFRDGRPNGPAEDFLTGFLKGGGTNDVFGRPVGVTVLANGDLLVADDTAGRIWLVRR